MAYVRKEEIAKKRKKVRELFPSKKGWKISITNQNLSTINVKVLQAPFQLLEDIKRDNESINYFHIESRYSGKKRDFLLQLYKIINSGNHDNSDSMTDYFDVGFYVNIEIGSWDKPFKVA